MPLTELIAGEAAKQYRRERDRYEKLAKAVQEHCVRLVDEAGIRAAVTHRAKDPKSFERKLLGYLAADNRAKIEQVETLVDAINMVGDLAAVRVATYVEADRERVVHLIEELFDVLEVDFKEKESGYRATHCQVMLPKSAVLDSSDLDNVADTSAEIQVCSMLAHVWNEIEHDIRYKLLVDWGDDADLRDQLLSEFRAAADEGDKRIEALLGLQSERIAQDLVETVADVVSELANFRDNGAEVLREFVRLGYMSVDAITTHFLTPDAISEGRALIGPINVDLEVAGMDGLRLSATNADVLLALLLSKHGSDLAALYERQVQENEARRAPRIAVIVKDLGTLDGR